MRYRHLGSRYAIIVTSSTPANHWHAGKMSIGIAQPCWRPATDMYETAHAIYITADLAGVETDNLDIILYQNAIIIEGCRKLPALNSEGVYHAAEIRHGPFRLELPLMSTINPEKMQANYEHGFLTIILKKLKRSKRCGS